MSRMAKFLKQTCQLEAVKLDSFGQPTMNDYGELEYESPVTIVCRKERYIRDLETSTGAIAKSSTEYYTVTPITINDKLDGRVILTIEEYTNELGKTEGFRSVT